MTLTDRTAPAPTRTGPPTGLAGLGSVAAVVAAFLVLPADDGGSRPADVVARYAEGSSGYLRAAGLESLSVALSLLFVAGLSLHLSRRSSATVAAVAAVGGVVLLTGQLIGYALIATLALGTAERGDQAVVMAVYDASALMFVVANVGLVLLAGATAVALRGSSRPMATTSAVVAIAAMAGAGTLASDGPFSPHGDLGFLVLLLQQVWTVVAAIGLLRAR